MAVNAVQPTPADIAAVQDVLKEVWVTDNLKSQLYEDMVLMDWVDDVKEYTDSDGLKASVPLKTGRTGGVGSRGIGQQLPAADHQRVGKASYNYKFHYLQVQLYGPVIARMATQRQSAVREIDFEVTNGISDLKRMLNRQLHGDGTGAILISGLPGGASSTTVLLGAANYPIIERGWLYEGMRIDIGTAANPQLDTGNAIITGIVDNAAAPAITVLVATATTAGSQISLAGNRGAGSVSYEINGMRSIISDTAVLGGIDPSVTSYWKAYINANGGTPRALSINLMLNTLRKVRQLGEYPDVALCDLVQEQAYYNLLQGQVRFAGDTNLTAGNTEGLAFAKLKVVGDPEYRPGVMDFVKKGALQQYSSGDIEWQNATTGGDILVWRQDYDAYVARAAKYCEIGTDRRRSFASLQDLS
jgi:hypothetical protein